MKMNKNVMCGVIGFALGIVAHKFYVKWRESLVKKNQFGG